MNINEMSFQDRLKAGKEKEKVILDILNEIQPWLLTFESASEKEDIEKKIDAWAHGPLGLTKYSVQIKYRESGMDLGVALLRPWWGAAKFRNDYAANRLKHDRDYVSGADIYVCLAGDKLLLSYCDPIHIICDRSLEHLFKTGFLGDQSNDWQLRIVTDADTKQRKLICYIPYATLLREGGFLRVIK